MIGIIDNFIALSFFLFCLSIVCLLIIVATSVECDAFSNKWVKKWIKSSFAIAFISISFAVFTPDSKTLAAMYLIPKLAESDDIQKIPDKALKALNLKLDEWVKDLSEENK